MLLPPIPATIQTAPVRISVDAGRPMVEVPRSLFGVFFEEINHAGEGGIYGELLQNRSLAGFARDGKAMPAGWRIEAPASDAAGADRATTLLDFPLDTAQNRAHGRSIRLVRHGRPVSLVNDGFWGVPVRQGAKYRVTLWAKSDVPIRVDLTNGSSASFPATGGTWKRYGANLAGLKTDPKSTLKISPERDGIVQIAYGSLMPEKSWKGRENGLRPDLAERVNALQPGFFRFPGGCYIEGNSLDQAWDWKRTLGSPETRPGMPGTFWGYASSDGLGFHEYLQFCEDLGAKALFVANCGLSHSDMAPFGIPGPRGMDRYVQDTLDAIEYANGPVSSKWGAMRAKAGHPKPFDLKYVEIGNENGYSWSFGGPAAYAPRFRKMHDAIKAKYPAIVTIANNPIRDAGPQNYDLLSEHYYESPAWFWRNANRYDAYDRKGAKVYVGEYAVTKGSGRGNLAGALGEAAYMTGMERNADVVRMASYAPLLENVNARQWNPNAIIFNNTESYGTPSYWVQALFAQNRIVRVLGSNAVLPALEPAPLAGNLGLMTWNTQAEFKDVKIERDGDEMDIGTMTPEPTGQWSERDGVIVQTGPGENRQYILPGNGMDRASYTTLSLKARKRGGDEGFIILFGGTSEADRLQWNLGGWNNTQHAFQYGGAIVEPSIAPLASDQKIQTDRWYDVRLERRGDRVRGYLDGKLLQEITIPTAPDFASIAGRAENGDLLIRVVNGASVSRSAEIDLKGFRPKSGSAIVLSGSPADENSFESPTKVAPRTTSLPSLGATFLYAVPPHSLTILRLKR